MEDQPPPPPPPPHGTNPKTTKSGLPDGNYDIFIIPPHSSGSGFLYLPSLHVQRNSFLAGVACGISAIILWTAVILPALQTWAVIIVGNTSLGVALLVAVVAITAWVFGKTQAEKAHNSERPPKPDGGGASNSNDSQEHKSSKPQYPGSTGHPPRPQPEWTPPSSPPPHPPRQEPESEPKSQHQHNTSWASPPPQHPRHEPAPEPKSYHQRDNSWTAPPPQHPQQEHAPEPKPYHQRDTTWASTPPQQPRQEPTPEPTSNHQRNASWAQPQPAPKDNTPQSSPKKPTSQSPPPGSALWQKAMEEEKKRREEAKKREDARVRLEELRKSREETQKKKEESERLARAAAEKLRWEQKHQRDKEALELAAREKLANEKLEKERQRLEAEKQAQETASRIAKQKLELEKAARAKLAAEEAAKSKPSPTIASSESSRPPYVRPSAQSYASTETATTARPPPGRPSTLASSVSSYTESSYAPSTSTARTSVWPSRPEPYVNKDPDNVTLTGVYLYDSSKVSKPVLNHPISQLVCYEGGVGDGLILRIDSAGLFIDDDVRKVPQREWDVKAWGIKSIEIGALAPYRVLRATMRAEEGKKYVFVMPFDQGVKLDQGIARLRKGNLVRSLGMNHLKTPEIKKVLGELGYSV